ncbi:tagatose 1,6-diphosphate aldolase [Hoeflea poritis]|uniref:Tagatose 1,6-diphosphate aldolase n=1 Tax=Hoeflea poritis TaxID=2993659 RepID=A0ABT4VNN9_9HYPH|nr:tagatose 1,6-diphosphate aldolase [Hoeflea poritis]MDA4845775.1 tagatose 1,6-diphosphate aldolase [Hoeflea poritis]
MGQKKPEPQMPMYGVAVDQGSGLGAAIAEARGSEARETDLFDFKKAVVECLSRDASVLLVDAEYGRELLPHFNPACEKLLAYEADVYRIATSERITVLPDNLSVADYAGLGVRRLKFFLYYAPRGSAETNEKKHGLVRDIGRQCADHGIEFLFEPIVYDETVTDSTSLEFARLKPDLVREATAIYADPDFAVDVLKVEIPVNLAFVEGFGSGEFDRGWALDCFRQAAAAAGPIPLVYLSAGVSFDWFEQSLRLAREAGVNAAGFMCGRAIWSDAVAEFGHGGHARLTEWLTGEGRRRLERLKAAL